MPASSYEPFSAHWRAKSAFSRIDETESLAMTVIPKVFFNSFPFVVGLGRSERSLVPEMEGQRVTLVPQVRILIRHDRGKV